MSNSIPDFDKFNFEEYLRAGILVSSRIFSVLKGDTETRIMLPIIDMLNHQNPNNVSWKYNQERNGVEISAVQKIKAGSEICLSYGTNQNVYNFLLNYGFYDKT